MKFKVGDEVLVNAIVACVNDDCYEVEFNKNDSVRLIVYNDDVLQVPVLSEQTKPEPEPAPREWMDAPEAWEKLSTLTKVWGWSAGDKVRKFIHDLACWTTPSFFEDGCMPFSWDVDHQPTHVMPMIEGEEPPAPPVVETPDESWERVCRYVADNLDGMDAYKVAGLFIEMQDRIAALEKRVNELSK